MILEPLTYGAGMQYGQVRWFLHMVQCAVNGGDRIAPHPSTGNLEARMLSCEHYRAYTQWRQGCSGKGI